MCPVGTYKNNSIPGENCQTCPTDYVTEGVGAISIDNCTVFACLAGQRINSTGDGCENCTVGTYQDQPYQTQCEQCPVNTTTRSTASTNSSQCEAICPDGYEQVNTTSVSCELCPVGYYRNQTEHPFEQCQLCPVEFITDGMGAVTVEECSIANCSAGFSTFSNASYSECEICPVGTYQPDKWQDNCINCSASTTTLMQGSTNSSECLFFCPIGQQAYNNSACELCPVGTYKNNTIPGQNCSACPVNYVTEATGAIAEENCTVLACPAGRKINSTEDGCEDCPVGTYQDQPYQSQCIDCPPNTSTRNTASTNISQCEDAC
jgi:hypothetical protein